jgi:hypothetical protein
MNSPHPWLRRDHRASIPTRSSPQPSTVHTPGDYDSLPVTRNLTSVSPVVLTTISLFSYRKQEDARLGSHGDTLRSWLYSSTGTIMTAHRTGLDPLGTVTSFPHYISGNLSRVLDHHDFFKKKASDLRNHRRHSFWKVLLNIRHLVLHTLATPVS